MCACECLCVHLTVCIITYQVEELETFLVSARLACFGLTVRVGTQAGLLWISNTQAGKVRFTDTGFMAYTICYGYTQIPLM